METIGRVSGFGFGAGVRKYPEQTCDLLSLDRIPNTPEARTLNPKPCKGSTVGGLNNWNRVLWYIIL